MWLLVTLFFTAAALGTVIYFTQPMRAHKAARLVLAERTATVDRLLDFSQTIQGAGKPDQVFATLSHFLRTELSLSGLAVLTTEPDVVPPVQLRAAWPEDLVNVAPLSDLDTATCPCLRQNLPRCFKPEGSPVRCSIDASLKLPANHPAYCIPFNIGLKKQALIHMLLAPGSEWTEKSRQLAQTYVNSAQSVLTTLHLLAEAEKQSMTDALTGLFNRRSMEQLLQREMALCDRHNHSLSLVMIDLDHFKKINDTYGHAAGDHMLRAFADCVRMTLRKTDLAFRYGGDEFVIALPQTPLFQAQQVVQKLRQAFMSVDFSHAITHLEAAPTLSIGVAERNKAANILTLSTLLGAADQALYAAKNSTRNCVKIFEPPQAA
jgi:diguanylate cyclase (GGDEF)-like protein